MKFSLKKLIASISRRQKRYGRKEVKNPTKRKEKKNSKKYSVTQDKITLSLYYENKKLSQNSIMFKIISI